MIDTVQNYVSSYSSEEGYGGRIEVVTGPTGRRRWPDHVKAAIVLESHRDGVSVADVARKHDVCAPQLHSWRRAAREGLLALPDDDVLGLMPVVVEAGGGQGGGTPHVEADTIVLELNGVRVFVPPSFDTAHLGRVISAVRTST